MTQEFHLRVTALGANDVYVRVDRGPVGTPLAEERLQWPVADWLHALNQILSDPLGGNPMDPLTLGQSLYRSLFDKSLGESWGIALGIAENRREILRLRLGVRDDATSPNRLQSLPWEILHDGHSPLTTAQSVIFSRYQPRFAALNNFSSFTDAESAPLPQEGTRSPLRVLMVLAESNPAKHGFSLALKQEAQILQGELHPDETSPLRIELDILEQPGREQLTHALEQGKYHIFHFSGHSSPEALHLVNRKTGLTERLAGEDLAGLLRNNGVSLALLNSCRGHYQDPSRLSLAEQKPHLADVLVQAGLPAVLAMAEQIPDRVAVTLTRLFYRNLKLGYPIDLSLCRARQGLLSSYGSEYFYWCLPVLYLRSDFDGRFFDSGVPIHPTLEQTWLRSPALDVSALALEQVENPAVDPLAPPRPAPIVAWVDSNPDSSIQSITESWVLLDESEFPELNGKTAPIELPPSIDAPLLPVVDSLANPVPPDLPPVFSESQDWAEAADRSAEFVLPSDETILDHLPLPPEPEAQRWLAQLSISGDPEEEDPVLSREERLLPDSTALLNDRPAGMLYPDLPEDSVPAWGGGEFLARQRTTSLMSQGTREALLESLDQKVPATPDPQPVAAVSPDPETRPQFHLAESAAITLYRQTLALNPTDSRTYHKLGLSLVQAGQVEEAIEAYQQSLTFNPNEAEVYCSLGKALCRLGQYAHAIVAYRQAIALNANLPEVYRLLAVALAKQGQAICFPQRSAAVVSKPEPPTPEEWQVQGPVIQSAPDLPLDTPPSAATWIPRQWLQQPQLNAPWGIPLWVWLASTSVTAIVTLSFLFSSTGEMFHPLPFQWKLPQNADPTNDIPTDPAVTVQSTLPSNTPDQIGDSPELQGTQAVMTYALDSFEQEQWLSGEEALRSLLERSALVEAQTVFNQLGSTALDRPELSFLYGRLAWQAVQSGNGNFSREDARRYWESASQQNPESAEYLNALAFAHYHLGNLTTAKQLWLRVLPLEGETKDPLFANGNPLGGRFPEVAPIPTQEGLTASAGLGLVLWRLGVAQPVGQQSQFLNQASQLYDRVMSNNAEAFTIDELSQDWLWTETAIQDWKALGQVAGNAAP